MLKQIRAEQLQLGMHLHKLCGSWMSHPFWRRSFVLNDPKDIQRIRDSGIQQVWIDLAKGLDVDAGPREQASAQDSGGAPLAPPPPTVAPQRVALGKTGEAQASQKVLGASYTELGQGVAHSWGFPQKIIGSMARDTSNPAARGRSNADETTRLLACMASDLSAVIVDSNPDEQKKRCAARANSVTVEAEDIKLLRTLRNQAVLAVRQST